MCKEWTSTAKSVARPCQIGPNLGVELGVERLRKRVAKIYQGGGGGGEDRRWRGVRREREEKKEKEDRR